MDSAYCCITPDGSTRAPGLPTTNMGMAGRSSKTDVYTRANMLTASLKEWVVLTIPMVKVTRANGKTDLSMVRGCGEVLVGIVISANGVKGQPKDMVCTPGYQVIGIKASSKRP